MQISKIRRIMFSMFLFSNTLFAGPTGPKMVSYTPIARGKSAGPIGFRVSYPKKHDVNRPLTITVDVWCSSGDSDQLIIGARPRSSQLNWTSGSTSVSFNNVGRNQKKSYTFTVTPKKTGEYYIAVDGKAIINGKSSSRSIAVLVRAGSSLRKEHLFGRNDLF